MFFASTALYLSLRKSSLLGTSSQINNLAMFALPLVIYGLLLLWKQIPLTITFTQLMSIIVISIVFSYLGNLASLKSIERAPNP